MQTTKLPTYDMAWNDPYLVLKRTEAAAVRLDSSVKTCPGCKKVKPHGQFYIIRRKGERTRSSWCVSCHKEYNSVQKKHYRQVTDLKDEIETLRRRIQAALRSGSVSDLHYNYNPKIFKTSI